MNELVIPPAPLWYKSGVVACAPDNTLIYGSKNDIVIIKETPSGEPSKVQIIQGSHSKHIISISLNRKWKNPHAYAVSLGEENAIKVWDLDTLEKKFVNTDHTEHKESVVGAVFAGADRIVSISTSGLIIVWNITTNESKPIKNIFKDKVNITCLSSCPHSGWLVAFGCNKGVITIADLRRNGTCLYRLRGHYEAVLSMSWCPAPVNVFPRNPRNTVKNQSLECEKTESSENTKDEKTDGGKNTNPWVNLVHADDEEVVQKSSEPLQESPNDFLKDCEVLKSKILGVLDKNEVEHEEKGIAETEGTLTPQKKLNSEIDNSSNGVFNDSEICQKLDPDRPLPTLYDPSCDFLDDSPEEEIFENRDTGDEKGKHEDSGVIMDDKEIKKENNEEVSFFKTEETASNRGASEASCSKTDENTSYKENSEVCCSKPEIVTEEEEPRQEYLLASIGKDKSVYIWRAGTDGRMQTMFHKPKKSRKDVKNPHNWSGLCWIAPNIILTTTVFGEVLMWPMPKPKESNKQFKVLHNEHTSTIFNVVAPPKYSTSYNWRDQNDLFAWTTGQDGRLINYDLKNKKVRLCYSTITANVTCFDSSVLDPNRLAIGIRDGSVRVWDLSLPHCKIITMHNFQQKITQKVSAIAWNPIQEMILGFGTEEGRVGFIETSKKKSTLFTPFFHSQVYKVEWGPIGGCTTNLGLYALAEGKILIYDMTAPKKDPIHLELPDQLQVYKFAWKPDFSLLLLNSKDFSLVSLTPDFTAINTVYLYDKGMNAIVWHPDAFCKDDISPRSNWFAATTSKGLLVYDSVLLKENTSKDANLMEKIVVSFEGHVKPPGVLAWCPFDGNQIVSAATDGLVHVWNVSTKSCVATFVEPYFCGIHALIWSPVDPDLIIIGERIVRLWKVSQNPPKIDEDFLAERKRLLAKSVKTETSSEKTKIRIELPKVKNNPKNFIVPSLYVSNDEHLELQAVNMRGLMVDKENNTFTKKDYKLDPLQLFGEKEDVSTLLTANYDQQKKEAKFRSCELISLWKGDIGKYVEEAIAENRVTPNVITLAPMVSLKLWQDSCEIYAKKLLESADSEPLETAMYFLACHKVQEAIDCLCSNNMFKEALALAKERLPINSDVINDVTEKWAEHCINSGNFETAAYCYISIGKNAKAAKVLAKRNNTEFLELAIELAEKEDKALSDCIKFKLNEIQSSQLNASSVVEESLPSRIEAVIETAAKDEKENKALSDCIKFKLNEIQSSQANASLVVEESLPSRIEAVIETAAKDENTNDFYGDGSHNETKDENKEVCTLISPEQGGGDN